MIPVIDNKIEEVKNKFNEKLQDIEVGLSHSLAKSVTKPNEKIKDITLKDRAMYAALGGIAAAAATPIISKFIFRNKNMSIPLFLANIASSATTGYFTPDIANVIRGEVKGDISSKEAKKIIKDFDLPSRKVFEETKEISKLYGSGFKKQAGIFRSAFRLAGSTARRTGGAIGKGIYVGKNPSIRKRIWGYGVKGGLLTGAGYGTYRGIKRFSGPRSNANYTTFIRNQLLSGNIHPSELSQQDLIAVRKLGMR